MSGDEGFLARWARRKREAAAEPRRPEPAAEPDTPAREPGPEPAELPPLPPLETIDAASDITAFLAPGVPASLTRAALRRAWTADPAIRDFIGLSENSWDFTAPDGVPGFGSLDADQVRRLVEDFFAEPKPAESPEAAEQVEEPPRSQLIEPTTPTELAEPTLPDRTVVAQEATEPRKSSDSAARRRHGGALPQ